MKDIQGLGPTNSIACVSTQSTKSLSAVAEKNSFTLVKELKLVKPLDRFLSVQKHYWLKAVQLSL